MTADKERIGLSPWMTPINWLPDTEWPALGITCIQITPNRLSKLYVDTYVCACVTIVTKEKSNEFEK